MGVVGVVIDDDHKQVHNQITELLAAKIKLPNAKQVIPFSFFKKVRGCACMKAGTCACAKAAEHVLVISSGIAKQAGLGLEKIVIRGANPWAVYSSLALLVINTTSGGTVSM